MLKPAVLTDGVVRLEPLAERHVEAMHALAQDGDVVRFTRVRAPFDVEAARAWVGRYVRGWEDGSLGGFAIVAADDGAFLGFAAVVDYEPEARQGELGYVVAPAARGRGVAVRALRLLAEWALRDAGLERVELLIQVENAPSEAVAARAGFTREGVLRSLHVKGDERADQAVWSLLRSELA